MMDPVALLFAGGVVLSAVLLAGLCLSCRRNSAPFRIQPNYSSEDYIQPTPGMHVIRSYQPNTTWVMPSSTLSPTSLTEQIARHNSFAPTENESLPSYENPAEAEYQNTEDEDEEGPEAPYVDVLPDSPVMETCPSTQSLASTQSSEPPYVNVDREQEDYQNVEPGVKPGVCVGVSSESDEDSDDETSNYVNQGPMKSDIEVSV